MGRAGCWHQRNKMAQAELPVQFPLAPTWDPVFRDKFLATRDFHSCLSLSRSCPSCLQVTWAGCLCLPCAPPRPGVRPHAPDRGWRPLRHLLRKQERQGKRRPPGPGLQCGQRSESKWSNWHPAYLQRKLFTFVSNFKQINESLLQEILALK